MVETSGFAHDVFISYRQQDPDQAWVQTRFVPALRACGLRVCVDYDDFRFGMPVLSEMERGVETSSFTIAVLSPAFLGSKFTEIESIMARHLGLEEGTQRFIAVLREPCRPSLSIRACLWLDMTNDAAFATGVERLVEYVRNFKPARGPR